MYEQLIIYIKKNFIKAILDMLKHKGIENNDEEQEKLIQGDFFDYKELALISKYTRIIERGITYDAKHIQEIWERFNRIETLENRLRNTQNAK